MFSFPFCSGANPNAQTTETEEMKVKAAERTRAREAAKIEARQNAIEKFKEIQTAKAAEKAKEVERQKKAHKLPSPQPKAAPPVSAITANKMDSFEADLGHSTNPFDEQDFSFSADDETNPFLDDIRAASAAASALSFGGNPFEETPSIGEINRLIHYLHKISDGLNFGPKNVRSYFKRPRYLQYSIKHLSTYFVKRCRLMYLRQIHIL